MDNVKKAWKELKHILPVEISSVIDDTAIEIRIEDHDESKYSPLEYPAYDEYFYPKKTDKTQDEINKAFAYAWNLHQKGNTHHWQFYVLLNDDGTTKVLDMEIHAILEMVCDWWAFSWKINKPLEIIDFYEKNKNNMMLSDKTRLIVESILDKIERAYKNDIC